MVEPRVVLPENASNPRVVNPEVFANDRITPMHAQSNGTVTRVPSNRNGERIATNRGRTIISNGSRSGRIIHKTLRFRLIPEI